MSACIFCDIVAGEAPASVIYQDDVVLAFMDITPVNLGHILVVPRKHATYMADMDEAVGMSLFQVTMRIGQAIRNSSVRCEGINLFLADGAAAGQEIYHLHMHVFPRFTGDHFRIFAGGAASPSRMELDEIATSIRSAYQSLF
jgi:histidine triad (HIT) family protein